MNMVLFKGVRNQHDAAGIKHHLLSGLTAGITVCVLCLDPSNRTGFTPFELGNEWKTWYVFCCGYPSFKKMCNRPEYIK